MIQFPVRRNPGWRKIGDTTVFPDDTAKLADCVIPKYVTFIDSCLREFERKQ